MRVIPLIRWKASFWLAAVLVLLMSTGVRTAAAQDIFVDFGGDITGQPGDLVTIEVSASDLTGLDVTSIEFRLKFDPDLITIDMNDIQPGPVVASINKWVFADHRVNVDGGYVNPLQGAGVLFTITGTLGPAGFNEEGFRVNSYRLTTSENVNLDVSPEAPVFYSITSTSESLSLPAVEGDVFEQVTIPVSTDDLSLRGVRSYELEFSFDPQVIEITGYSAEGTLSQGGNIAFSTPEAGKARIEAGFPADLGPGQVLIQLLATLAGPGDQSPLTFSKVELLDAKDDLVAVGSVDGTVTVNATPGSTGLLLPQDGDTDLMTTVTFEWLPADRADRYQFQLATDADFLSMHYETTVWASGDDATVLTVEDLDDGTTYFWRLRADNAWEEGPWSAVWTFTTEQALMPPDAVQLLSPENESVGLGLLPDFYWQVPFGADSYEIQLSSGADFEVEEIVLQEAGLLDTGFSVQDSLDYETTYFWRVRGENDAGPGHWSDVWSFTTEVELLPPDAVTLLMPQDGSEGLELLPAFSWEAVEGAEVYALQLGADAGFENVIFETGPLGATEFSLVEELDYETTYFWRVRAENNAGPGPWSDVWSFTTEVELLPPDAVTLLMPQDGSEGLDLLPVFSWEAAEGAEVYVLQLGADAGFDEVVAEAADLEDTQLALSEELAYGTTYFWRVRAGNDAGHGPWSEVWSFTTEEELLPPDAVVLVSPQDQAEGVELMPAFSWESQDNAIEYEGELAADAAFEQIIVNITGLTETSYVLPEELDYETTYFWRVRGVNDAGPGPWSDVWSFTTLKSTSTELNEIPQEFVLMQNYPNPFNPSTQIRFALPEAVYVRLAVYNLLGQQIALPVNEVRQAGWHQVAFDASSLPSGLFIYRLEAGSYAGTRHMMYVK